MIKFALTRGPISYMLRTASKLRCALVYTFVLLSYRSLQYASTRFIKLAWAFLMAAPLARANCSKESIALRRFYQSLVLQLSTSVFISSIMLRSTGLETEVVLLLNVFYVPSKPEEDPWLLAAPLCIVRWWSLMTPPRGTAFPIPLVPIGPLLPPRAAELF